MNLLEGLNIASLVTISSLQEKDDISMLTPSMPDKRLKGGSGIPNNFALMSVIYCQKLEAVSSHGSSVLVDVFSRRGRSNSLIVFLR
jgi:hypothetical protein